MKVLKKIKLNHLNDDELKKREMNNLRGGDKGCGCGCHYVDSNGSSVVDNAEKNYEGGKTSYGGDVICKVEINGSIAGASNKSFM